MELRDSNRVIYESEVSYSPRSASRLLAATIERAVSSSTSTIPTSIVVQPSDRAAIQRVIARQHLVTAASLAAPVDHDRPVLAVLGQRHGDLADIAAARVTCEGVQVIDGKLRVFRHAPQSRRQR